HRARSAGGPSRRVRAVLSIAVPDGEHRRAQLALALQNGIVGGPLVRGTRRLSLRAQDGAYRERAPDDQSGLTNGVDHQGPVRTTRTPDRRAGDAGAGEAARHVVRAVRTRVPRAARGYVRGRRIRSAERHCRDNSQSLGTRVRESAAGVLLRRRRQPRAEGHFARSSARSDRLRQYRSRRRQRSPQFHLRSRSRGEAAPLVRKASAPVLSATGARAGVTPSYQTATSVSLPLDGGGDMARSDQIAVRSSRNFKTFVVSFGSPVDYAEFLKMPGLYPARLLQVKRPHRPVARHQHILATAYGVRLRSVVDRTDMAVPQRHGRPLPPQPKGNKTPGRVVGEQQTPRGCEQTGGTAVAAPRSLEAIFPGELSRLVIDRGDGRTERSDDILLAASQPYHHAWVRRCQVVNRVELAQHDVEESRLGVVAGRKPVRRASIVRRYQRARDRVVLVRVALGLPPGVDAGSPVGRVGVLHREQMLAIGSIQHVEVAVARRLHRHCPG